MPQYLYICGIILVSVFVHHVQGKQILVNGHPFQDETTEPVHGMDKVAEARYSVTFPGTKWCGPGNTASGYDELGVYNATDKCCRDHDHCENIPAGEQKFGLKNNDWFTRLHCDCDKTFFNCLHKVNRTVSTVIGRQYFFFRDRCFKNAHPIVECVNYQTRVFVRRCVEYRFDTLKPKKYQWFDLPLYDIENYPDLNDSDFYEQQHQHQQVIGMGRSNALSLFNLQHFNDENIDLSLS